MFFIFTFLGASTLQAGLASRFLTWIYKDLLKLALYAAESSLSENYYVYEQIHGTTGGVVNEDSVEYSQSTTLDSKDTIAVYRIRKLGPSESSNSKMTIGSLTLNVSDPDYDYGYGIWHVNDGSYTHKNYGSINIENFTVNPAINCKQHVAGILQENDMYISGDVNIGNADIHLKANYGSTAYIILQEPNAFISGNVNIKGSIRGTAFKQPDGTLKTDEGFCDVAGIRGGSYNGNIALDLTSTTDYGRAYGVYLEDSSTAKTINGTTETPNKLDITSYYGASAIGIMSEGATITDGISYNNITVYSNAHGSKYEEVDAAAVGIHLAEGSVIGKKGITHVNINATSYAGIAAGIVYNNTNKDALYLSNLNISSNSSHGGRAVALAFDNPENIEVNSSVLTVSALGRVYGLAFGKDVSGETDSMDGAVAVFSKLTKDSHGVDITNSEICANSIGTTNDLSQGMLNNAYALYLEANSSYSLIGNSFSASSAYTDAIGAYVSDNSYVTNVKKITVNASYHKAIGIEISGASYFDGSASNTELYVKAHENAYGVLAQNDGTNVKGLGNVTVESLSTNAYGAHISDNASVNNALSFTVTAKDNGDAYGMYIDNASGSASSITATSNNKAYGVYLTSKSSSFSADNITVNTDGGVAYGVYTAEDLSDAISTNMTINNKNKAFGLYYSDETLGEKESVAFYNSAKKNSTGIKLSTDTTITVNVNGTDDAYGVYLANTTEDISTLNISNIETSSNGNSFGVYLNGSKLSSISGAITAISNGTEAIALKINENSQVADMSASTTSIAYANSTSAVARGIEISNKFANINVNKDVSASLYSGTATPSENQNAIGIHIVDANKVSIASRVRAHCGFDSQKGIAVQTHSANEIIFNNAILETPSSEGIAMKSVDVDMNFSGTASFYGDLLSGTSENKNDINAKSGQFSVEAKNIVAKNLVLGSENKSGEVETAQIKLTRNTNLDIDNVVLYANSTEDLSSIHIYNFNTNFDSNQVTLNLIISEATQWEEGAKLRIIELDVDRYGTISTLNNLTEENISITLAGVELDKEYFSYSLEMDHNDSDKLVMFGVITLGDLSSIPEPSTYAIIFATIALAAVMYRKRKA